MQTFYIILLIYLLSIPLCRIFGTKVSDEESIYYLHILKWVPVLNTIIFFDSLYHWLKDKFSMWLIKRMLKKLKGKISAEDYESIMKCFDDDENEGQ